MLSLPPLEYLLSAHGVEVFLALGAKPSVVTRPPYASLLPLTLTSSGIPWDISGHFGKGPFLFCLNMRHPVVVQ